LTASSAFSASASPDPDGREWERFNVDIDYESSLMLLKSLMRPFKFDKLVIGIRPTAISLMKKDNYRITLEP
jgi:hypothetical protein